MWGEDLNGSRYDSYANHRYRLVEAMTPAVPAEETDFSTGTFVSADLGSAAGKARRWAERQPGYADLWIDRDNHGWIVVAFAQGAGK